MSKSSTDARYLAERAEFLLGLELPYGSSSYEAVEMLRQGTAAGKIRVRRWLRESRRDYYV